MRYACIARHRRAFPVRLMCRVLAVSVSGFYAAQARQRRAPSAHARTDHQLRLQVRAAHAQSQRRNGAPRVHRDLTEAGIRTSCKRGARLIREDGLRARRMRRFRVTTQSTHAYPVAANVLARAFDARAIRAINRVWAADFTYVETREGWLYLAVVLDLFSRRAVGWATSARLETTLATSALRMALPHRRLPPHTPLLHHSDRGSQYASADYRAQLAAYGVTCSMSRKGNCWDNAVVESFFATLKTELVHGARWLSRAAAHRAPAEYIDGWYNYVRRHSTLG